MILVSATEGEEGHAEIQALFMRVVRCFHLDFQLFDSVFMQKMENTIKTSTLKCTIADM